MEATPYQTPYQRLRQVDIVITRLGAAIDMDEQSTAGRISYETLRRTSRRAVDMLKDYEMFVLEDDTSKRVRLLPQTIEGLEKLRTSLLHASEYDLISAVDVAQLSLEVDELIRQLR